MPRSIAVNASSTTLSTGRSSSSPLQHSSSSAEHGFEESDEDEDEDAGDDVNNEDDSSSSSLSSALSSRHLLDSSSSLSSSNRLLGSLRKRHKETARGRVDGLTVRRPSNDDANNALRTRTITRKLTTTTTTATGLATAAQFSGTGLGASETQKMQQQQQQHQHLLSQDALDDVRQRQKERGITSENGGEAVKFTTRRTEKKLSLRNENEPVGKTVNTKKSKKSSTQSKSGGRGSTLVDLYGPFDDDEERASSSHSPNSGRRGDVVGSGGDGGAVARDTFDDLGVVSDSLSIYLREKQLDEGLHDVKSVLKSFHRVLGEKEQQVAMLNAENSAQKSTIGALYREIERLKKANEKHRKTVETPLHDELAILASEVQDTVKENAKLKHNLDDALWQAKDYKNRYEVSASGAEDLRIALEKLRADYDILIARASANEEQLEEFRKSREGIRGKHEAQLAIVEMKYKSLEGQCQQLKEIRDELEEKLRDAAMRSSEHSLKSQHKTLMESAEIHRQARENLILEEQLHQAHVNNCRLLRLLMETDEYGDLLEFNTATNEFDFIRPSSVVDHYQDDGGGGGGRRKYLRTTAEGNGKVTGVYGADVVAGSYHDPHRLTSRSKNTFLNGISTKHQNLHDAIDCENRYIGSSIVEHEMAARTSSHKEGNGGATALVLYSQPAAARGARTRRNTNAPVGAAGGENPSFAQFSPHLVADAALHPFYPTEDSGGPLRPREIIDLKSEAHYWIPHDAFIEAQRWRDAVVPQVGIKQFYELFCSLNAIWRERLQQRLATQKRSLEKKYGEELAAAMATRSHRYTTAYTTTTPLSRSGNRLLAAPSASKTYNSRSRSFSSSGVRAQHGRRSLSSSSTMGGATVKGDLRRARSADRAGVLQRKKEDCGTVTKQLSSSLTKYTRGAATAVRSDNPPPTSPFLKSSALPPLPTHEEVFALRRDVKTKAFGRTSQGLFEAYDSLLCAARERAVALEDALRAAEVERSRTDKLRGPMDEVVYNTLDETADALRNVATKLDARLSGACNDVRRFLYAVEKAATEAGESAANIAVRTANSNTNKDQRRNDSHTSTDSFFSSSSSSQMIPTSLLTRVVEFMNDFTDEVESVVGDTNRTLRGSADTSDSVLLKHKQIIRDGHVSNGLGLGFSVLSVETADLKRRQRDGLVVKGTSSRRSKGTTGVECADEKGRGKEENDYYHGYTRENRKRTHPLERGSTGVVRSSSSSSSSSHRSSDANSPPSHPYSSKNMHSSSSRGANHHHHRSRGDCVHVTSIPTAASRRPKVISYGGEHVDIGEFDGMIRGRESGGGSRSRHGRKE